MNVTIGSHGEIRLPEDVARRYGTRAAREVRLLQTRSGILIVPLVEDQPSAELQSEIEMWQQAGEDVWQSSPGGRVD